MFRNRCDQVMAISVRGRPANDYAFPCAVKSILPYRLEETPTARYIVAQCLDSQPHGDTSFVGSSSQANSLMRNTAMDDSIGGS